MIEPTHAIAGSQSIDLWSAMWLGMLQGATEFLPVSSSGHLSLAQALMDIDPRAVGHRFNITVHAGTLLAVLWTYRHDLRDLARAAATPFTDSPARRMLVALFIGTLPLVFALTPTAETFVYSIEEDIQGIGIALWVTAALLALGTWLPRRYREAVDTPPSPWQALWVGTVQLCAIVPGISRSGSTISMGLVAGLHREQAARFSFLLSIPAILGATGKEALGAWSQPGSGDLLPFVVGFLVSFMVGLWALRILIRLVHQGRLILFVPYLIIVGAVALAL